MGEVRRIIDRKTEITMCKNIVSDLVEYLTHSLKLCSLWIGIDKYLIVHHAQLGVLG